jgi:hypothetical protein
MVREMRPATMIAVMFLLLVLVVPAFCFKLEPIHAPHDDLSRPPEAPPLPEGYQPRPRQTQQLQEHQPDEPAQPEEPESNDEHE